MVDGVEWVVTVGGPVDVSFEAVGLGTISWRTGRSGYSCGDEICMYQVGRLSGMLRKELW